MHIVNLADAHAYMDEIRTIAMATANDLRFLAGTLTGHVRDHLISSAAAVELIADKAAAADTVKD